MYKSSPEKIVAIFVIFSTGSLAKSLHRGQDDQQVPTPSHQQNPQAYQYSAHQHQYPYQQHVSQQGQQSTGTGNDPNYSAYPDDMESYDYQSSSSEEMMPVKNSEYVPIEDYSTDQNKGNETGGDNGYIPQRQVSLQQFWQNSAMFQPNDKVTDSGQIEIATFPVTNDNNNYYHQQSVAPGPTQQINYQQQFYEHYHHEEMPSSSVAPVVISEQPFQSVGVPKIKKTSNASKLIVVAGRTGEGKIAVVRDKMKAKRQRRSMMTLSREDENDSEYDDLKSSEKEVESVKIKMTNSTTISTIALS